MFSLLKSLIVNKITLTIMVNFGQLDNKSGVLCVVIEEFFFHSVKRFKKSMGMTSNIKYTCRPGGPPVQQALDSGCHQSSCFTCARTTLQSRSGGPVVKINSRKGEDAGQELESHSCSEKTSK